jgi:hypothetical protein
MVLTQTAIPESTTDLNPQAAARSQELRDRLAEARRHFKEDPNEENCLAYARALRELAGLVSANGAAKVE